MAFLRKYPGSKNWFAGFQGPNGERLQRSTGTPDRKLAQSIALKYESAAIQAGKGRFNDTAARAVISEIYALGIDQTALASSNVADFCQAWLSRKAVENDPAAHARYQAVISDFLECLGAKVKSDLARLSAADITNVRDLLAKRLSTTTVNLSLKVIRAALAQAKKDGLITENPAERVSILKNRDTPQRRPFTLPEIKKILSVANQEWRGLVLLGVYTGQRLGDLAGLNWAQVDLQNQEISLTSVKTNRRTVIPMAKSVIQYLESLPSNDDPTAPVFPESFQALESAGGRAGTLSNRFHRLLVAAALASARTHESTGKGRSAERKASGISFHCLRHTATSLLKNAGVSDAIAMDLIGHDSSAVSRQYTHVDTSAKRLAIQKMPDIDAAS